jgi:arylsulfatase A-like enzyme
MTGRFSFRTGMQHFTTLIMGSTAGIPKDTPTLAELMLDAGYETHAIGKWHLGYSSWAQTPTGRGFKSHTGYLQGQTEYYNHTIPACMPGGACLYHIDKNRGYKGGADGAALDFWKDKQAQHGTFGQYTTPLYLSAFDEVVAKRNKSRPLFVYFAEQHLHIPLELPPEPEHAERCAKVVGGSGQVNRTILCAMASKLDESVGSIVTTLKGAELWDNSLLWAFSDNGGMTQWSDSWPASASSNWPLRGGKTTLYEGGVRSVSFLNGGILPSDARGTVRKALLHAVDILPTVASLAGIALPTGVAFDGFDAWPVLTGKVQQVRQELPLNVDTNPLEMLGGEFPHLPHKSDGLANYTALIMWPWKLIVGCSGNPTLIIRKNDENVTDGWWRIDPYEREPPPPYPANHKPFLFDIEADEAERHDVADQHPDIVANMTHRIVSYWTQKAHGFVRSQLNLPTPLANPIFHNMTWSPWR